MAKTSAIHPADVLGFSRLAMDATVKLSDLVEAMHHHLALSPGIPGRPASGATRGITGLVYESIRAITGLAGSGIDASLAPLIPWFGKRSSPPGREAAIAALNGVMGDYLAATENPLAISMSLRRNGRPLTLKRPTGKLLVLAHGLCMNDLQWTRKGHNHGAALARDLGYTVVHLHYNSGLHISTNGRAFASLLETLLGQWPAPLEDFAIMGHSMGGLVARSACRYASLAGYGWSRYLRKMIFLGTPHHGTPLERGGNWLNAVLGFSPYTAELARLAKIRSAGITDLRYGNLLDDDWRGRDRFQVSPDRRGRLPLPSRVRCYAIAATSGRLLGDGVVPVDSALGGHKDPQRCLSFAKSRQWIGYGMNHFDLLSEPAVYERIKQWLT